MPSHPSQLRFPPREIDLPSAESAVHQLSDGTPVVVVEDHTLPLVDLVVALPTGGRVDATTALDQLTAALMRRGGTLERSPAALDRAIDHLGAEIDLLAGEERRVAYLDCLATTFDEAVELLFEILHRPAFDRERFEQLRQNFSSALAVRNDDPIEVMERELGWLLYGRQDRRARQPTAAELATIDAADTRRHHGAVWRPDEVVIAVSGAVVTEAILDRLESELASWKKAVASTPGEPPAARSGGERSGGSTPATGLYRAAHPTPQAKISLARTLPPIGDWDAGRVAAIEMANEILGGTGLVSRLGGRLRSRDGLVYRVLSEVEVRPERSGLFRIFLDTGTAGAARALEATVEEIERFRRRGVTTREVEAVRQELLTRLAQRFDSAAEIAGYFAEDLLLGRPHRFWSEYRRSLETVGATHIREIARELFDPAELVVVVVGGEAGVELPGTASSRHRLVRRWLRQATELPARDPYSLEPAEAPEPTAESPLGR